MSILLKRAYELPAKTDGMRVLVDRLWPRGLAKIKAKIDLWLKDVAPSTELRKWFGHDPEKWPEFQKKYRASSKAIRRCLSLEHARVKETSPLFTQPRTSCTTKRSCSSEFLTVAPNSSFKRTPLCGAAERER